MSRSSNLICRSYVAGADLSAHLFKAVKLNANRQVVAAGAGERATGILHNNPAAGQTATVAVFGASKVVLAGTVATGASAAVAAGGGVETAGAGDYILGIMDTGGVANDIGVVLLGVGSGAASA